MITDRRSYGIKVGISIIKFVFELYIYRPNTRIHWQKLKKKSKLALFTLQRLFTLNGKK